jgi:hypothetical protein
MARSQHSKSMPGKAYVSASILSARSILECADNCGKDGLNCLLGLLLTEF